MPISRFIGIVIIFCQFSVGVGEPHGSLRAQFRRPRMDGGDHRRGEIAMIERLRDRVEL